MSSPLALTSGTTQPPDAIEVAEVARTLRRGWRAVAGFLTLGIVGAVVVIMFAPPRYTGRASVLARSGSPDAGGGLLSKITGIGSIGADVLGGSSIETELQVLQSNALAERVIDTLKLQFRVRDPQGVPSAGLVQSSALSRSFKARTYAFQRASNGRYAVAGSDVATEMTPGQPVRLDVGSVTFAGTNLPDAFTLSIYDREEAIARFKSKLNVKKAGGDVAGVSYSAYDRPTAEAAPNVLVAFYLAQRKTVDRGTNERRVEYLTRELDEVTATLAATERALRRQQETSGVLDAEVTGEVDLAHMSQLRRTLVDLEVESGALNQLLAQLDSGKLKPRQLAAHPMFMRSSTLSHQINLLGDLEAQRIRILERRTEADPEVVALDQSIRMAETGLVSTARSSATTLTRQVTDMRAQIDSAQKSLAALPAALESGGRLQRDVERLSTIYAGVQAQLVQARLAAIGEGGLIRQLDVALAPRKPSFPNPWLTLAIGTLGGLFIGMFAALTLGWFGRWLRDPMEIERATGVVAQRLAPDTPLLVWGAEPRTLLVVPISDQARLGLVADSLVRSAKFRALNPTVLDLSRAVANGNGNGSEPSAISAVIDQLEQQHGMVVVQLPGLTNETTMAAMRANRPVLLVAPPGPVHRAQLENAVQMLRRLQVPCAGVVISDTAAGQGATLA